MDEADRIIEEDDRQANIEYLDLSIITPPWYNRCYFHDLRPFHNLLLVLCQALLCVLYVTSFVCFKVGNFMSKDKCSQQASFSQGGIMQYASTTESCDLYAYVCFANTALILVCLHFNWTAQLINDRRWLTAQLALVSSAVVINIWYCVVFVGQISAWCRDMNLSLVGVYESHSCYESSLLYDEKLIHDVNLSVAYRYSIAKLALFKSALAVYVLVCINLVYKLLVKINRKDYK